jgi:tripartite motif-containing protein 71
MKLPFSRNMIEARTALLGSMLAIASAGTAGPPPYPKDLGAPNILQPVKVIGGYGNKIGQFNEPHGIDFAADGRVIITDMHNNRVCLLSKRLEVDKCIGPSASRDRLSSPTIAKWLGPDRLIVADTGNRRIAILDLEGNILRSTVSGSASYMSEPTGVAILGDRIYVADKSAQKVHVLDRKLQRLSSFGGAGSGDGQFVDPSSIASNGSNRLFVADSYNNRIQIFDENGKFSGKFGDWGSFTGLLANPSSVSYASGTLFVSDLINHRIQAFEESGRYLLQWGRHPIVNHEGNGRLHYPEQTAVSADGSTAIVCEPFEHRCQIFNIQHATNVIKVDDRAWWDKNGRFHYGARPTIEANILAISEPDTHSVLIFDLSEAIPRFVTRIGGQGRDLGSLVKPSGVALSPDASKILVSDSGNFRIESFDLKASLDEAAITNKPAAQKFIGAVSTVSLTRALRPATFTADIGGKLDDAVVEPSALKYGPKGTILMCDPVNGRILEIDPNLKPIRYFVGSAPKELPGFRPNDLAFSPSGDRVYVVDFYHSRIAVFDKDGTYLFQFGSNGTEAGQFIHAFGIITSKTGDVYVSDEALNRIQIFDRDGKVLSSWGSWGAAPGQFYKPKGLAYDAARDRIIVADFGNHRAQIFDMKGTFISTFGIGLGYVPYTLGQPKATFSVNDGGSLPSNGGNFVVDYKFDGGRFSARKDYGGNFTVRKYNGEIVDPSIKVRVSAMMPTHYHGLAQSPVLRNIGSSTWRVDKVNFHMPGYWQLFFDIDNGIVTERAQIDIMVQ